MFQRFSSRQILNEFASKHISCASDELVLQLYINRLESRISRRIRDNFKAQLCGPSNLEKLEACNLIEIEKWKGSDLNCHNIIAFPKMIFKGKLYTTELYSSKFQRDNSIVYVNNNKNTYYARIKKLAAANLNCTCANFENQVCLLTNSSSLQNNTIIIGEKMEVRNVSALADAFCNAVNLTAFIRNVVEKPQVIRAPIVLIPSEIVCKCVLFPKNVNSEILIIKNDIRFEMD